MPTIIRQLTPRGLMPVAYTAESLADAAQHEPADGIYTVTNTYYTTQVLKLDAHFDRMQDSAARADLPLTLDRARLRSALRGMILTAGYVDSRFRITVGRAQPDHFTLTLEPYTPPSAELVEQGVRVVT
ncbi:MAG: aminotransferase class IV, partial [Armatimonadetes bacterium]|nr:aminotransferase class IV [Anaerolineae bacterium]